MRQILALKKLLLRRSSPRGQTGCSSYHVFLSPLLRPPSASLSLCLREAFIERSGSRKLSSGFCTQLFVRQIWCSGKTYASVAGFRSHFAAGAQSLSFSFPRRMAFGASQPYWRSYWRNAPTSDEVVLGLIGANIAVYFLWQFAPLSFMRRHFVISLENIKYGSLHTMLTSAFSHSELDHLFTNMIGLYFFGTSISRLFGPAFLLKLYVAGALGGSVFFLLHNTYTERVQPFHRRAQALGASAAVNAIILLDVFLFPKNIYYVNLVLPVPAILMGAFIIGSDLWRIKKGDENISGSAHMGGTFVALLAWLAIKKGWF